MRSRLKGMLIVLALAVVLMAVPAQAQDGGGLTEEESLLLDRVFAAREIYRGWSSFVEQGSGVQSREVSLKIGDTPQTQSTVATWERTSTIIRQDSDTNIQSSLAVTVDNTRFGGAVESYTVNADVRRVDEQLYVSAAYDGEIQPGWPALPAGWIEVEKISDWSGFQNLNLGDYLQQTTPFDNPERLKEVSPTVTLETGTLDDGTPVEIITVELGVEAIQSLFNTSVVDPSVTAMIISLGGETMGSLTYVLNPDNNTPYLIESRVTLQALDLSPEQFGQGISPNTKIDFTTSMVRSDAYSQVNESFDPAVVPEDVTP